MTTYPGVVVVEAFLGLGFFDSVLLVLVVYTVIILLFGNNEPGG